MSDRLYLMATYKYTTKGDRMRSGPLVTAG